MSIKQTNITPLFGQKHFDALKTIELISNDVCNVIETLHMKGYDEKEKFVPLATEHALIELLKNSFTAGVTLDTDSHREIFQDFEKLLRDHWRESHEQVVADFTERQKQLYATLKELDPRHTQIFSSHICKLETINNDQIKATHNCCDNEGNPQWEKLWRKPDNAQYGADLSKKLDNVIKKLGREPD